MQYDSGEDILIGDRVKLGEDDGGVVIAIIDRNEFLEGYEKEGYLSVHKGFFVEFPKWGLIHYFQAEEDLKLLTRCTRNK